MKLSNNLHISNILIWFFIIWTDFSGQVWLFSFIILVPTWYFLLLQKWNICEEIISHLYGILSFSIITFLQNKIYIDIQELLWDYKNLDYKNGFASGLCDIHVTSGWKWYIWNLDKIGINIIKKYSYMLGLIESVIKIISAMKNAELSDILEKSIVLGRN